ncbi:MAG TPA: sigma 54 modulation/S30EA ribosomal C-terminal domain-containing protein, partial [Thermoanaerobaculia bacterium]|nr:sigma 54 modulation/S30EA ribosomal C-terminal domain-containing protein [Thermoanaerobaculia bacterium]
DALNLAIDKVEKQARRSKSKAVDKRRRASRSADGQNHWPMDVLEAESLGSGEPPRVIKSSRLEIKPMSIDDAALALTSSKNDFIVFREAGTERIHVLYRRRDQNLGLISPELEA